MEKLTFFQDYTMYKEEDHATWSTLMQRMEERYKSGLLSKACLQGIQKLELNKTSIVKVKDISDVLESISGWTLVPVTGLIPVKDFFFMLINKRYPVTVYMRRPEEIDFSELPDIFHDVCGHLPLLTNDKFTRFLTSFSIIALKYVNNDRALELLGRLYWFTYEMGLIKEDNEYKAYGGAILTSSGEIENVRNGKVPKKEFRLEQVFRTPYNSFKLQNEYFVIDSFDHLFECIEQLEQKLIEQLLLPDEDITLRNYSLNPNLAVRSRNVIGFLNDVQFRFPEAISFAAGQPDERLFDVERHMLQFEKYVKHVQGQTGDKRSEVINRIGQYSKTKGLVNEIVSEYLKNDENIQIKGDHILMTVGAQEAFAVIVSTICDRDRDVILLEDPSYIGLSSFAEVFDYNLEPVAADEEGINIKALKSSLVRLNRQGKRIKLLYVIPDYQNPSGSCMPIGNRLMLLELAQKYNFLIIEDNVYNSFTYAHMKNPTLKSLDRYNRVIYVGSFSKSLFPGLRLGLIAANQQIENDMGESVLLINEMAKVKALLTNNTSAIDQAILAGVLLEQNGSLREMNKVKFSSYKQKCHQMLDALEEFIGAYANGWASDIKWNIPGGGFFIKISLPFPVDTEDVVECAGQFKVIVTPLRYFHLKGGGENEIRLSFSNLLPDEIVTGVKRLAAYIKSRVDNAVTERVTSAAQEYNS